LGGSGRKLIANPLADVLDAVADLAANFFAAGGCEKKRRPDSHAYSRGEGENVAQGVIFFPGIKIASPISQVRHAIASAVNSIGHSVPHIFRDAFGLVEQINYGF
jgi:hypothetical protein